MVDGTGSTSTADRALLRAIRAWGGPNFERATSRFSSDWRARLGPSWPSHSSTTPGEAWASLRRDHDASSRPDPSRIHPSWFVRALQGESRAVQLAVAANASAPIAGEIRRAFQIEPNDLVPDHPPDPEALRWALALWSERLVGDIPDRDDDPPVVVALIRLGLRDLVRLVKVCGLIKLAFSLEGTGPHHFDGMATRFSPPDKVRLGFLRRHIGLADRRLIEPARQDLGVMGTDRRRGLGRVGLLTFGRLLSAAEPHRSRWALQHIPYSVARGMRIKAKPPLPRKALLAWESWVLEAAWSRLLGEGQLSGGGDDLDPELES